jgi:hypothetical protein
MVMRSVSLGRHGWSTIPSAGSTATAPNDQLYFRLAPLLLRDLNGTGITFGRFTSAIAANRKREEVERELLKNDELARVLNAEAAIDPSWLLTREEMLHRPPHILITNYAMLEHLLLLPRNAPLFAQPRLQAIVLDEIHRYTGAQAIEVAYLLRKLRNRLQLAYPLQWIGTSASLGEGEDAESKTKRFASDLFGTEVTEVVHGRRLRDHAFGDLLSSWQMAPSAWAGLKEVCHAFHAELPEDPDDAARRELWADLTLEIEGLRPLPEDAALFGAAMLQLFAANAEMQRASRALEQQTLRFDELAHQVFGPVPEAGEALAGLFAVGVLCRASDKEFSLLPARYHLALSGIEGVSVRLDAEHAERWSDLAGKRAAGDAQDRYWPLLTCRNCGQPYIEAYADGAGLAPRPASTHAERRVLWHR